MGATPPDRTGVLLLLPPDIFLFPVSLQTPDPALGTHVPSSTPIFRPVEHLVLGSNIWLPPAAPTRVLCCPGGSGTVGHHHRQGHGNHLHGPVPRVRRPTVCVSARSAQALLPVLTTLAAVTQVNINRARTMLPTLRIHLLCNLNVHLLAHFCPAHY